MRTTQAILAEIRRLKTCSIQQLYRYFAAFHIEPVGVRQRPQLYPNDAAERILKQLGLIEGRNYGTHSWDSISPAEPARHKTALVVKSRRAPTALVSMRELRSEKANAARRAA